MSIANDWSCMARSRHTLTQRNYHKGETTMKIIIMDADYLIQNTPGDDPCRHNVGRDVKTLHYSTIMSTTMYTLYYVKSA